jgi:branched-chain amino acid transport system ATP-binding protein
MALLEVDGIVAGYVAGIDILNGLRLCVEPGTITGIIGPNGAGKSTLLKTIFGFLHPRQGRIIFDGREIQRLSPHTLKRLGISYAPQGTNIFPHLTVHENLQLGAWVYSAFPRLYEKRRRHATALSGGEAKMLSVAKEQVTNPTLLLVDEPSAGLAPLVAQQVYAQLLQARAQGVTILLVDQNISKAVEISDYLYMLEMGQVRHQGPRQAFTDQLRTLIRDALLGV